MYWTIIFILFHTLPGHHILLRDLKVCHYVTSLKLKNVIHCKTKTCDDDKHSTEAFDATTNTHIID